MALKDMLVLLDNSPHCLPRLELAIGLARRHAARLTGLYVTSHGFYEPQQGDAESKAARLEAEFRGMTDRGGITATWLGVDWKVIGVAVAEIVILHAHYADLVIIGQTDHGSQDRSIPTDTPERVVQGAGRPVLIVPYAGMHANVGTRIMVAWKSGRESTRAVGDALPLLEQAEQISVLEVNPAPPEGEQGARLCTHLAVHGITARAEWIATTDVGVGDVLLNRVSTAGSDLLVMGACTPSRFGTPVLGEVARHILAHMTVPVLMSH
ncbi:MAG TPA: universal stress protein [Geobacteraceae bacterium]